MDSVVVVVVDVTAGDGVRSGTAFGLRVGA